MDWYYARNNERIGPVEEKELVRLLGAGEIPLSTLVWKEGMTDWVQIGSLPEFASLSTGPATPSSFPDLSSAPGVGLVTCVVSGRQYPQDQVLKIGNDYVSAEYKDIYLQRLREGVSVGLDLAGFGIRLVALIVDWLILAAITLLVIVPLVFLSVSTDNSIFMALFQIFASVFYYGLLVLYEGVFVGKWGATPGKMVCKLKVVRTDGSDLTYGRAFGRGGAQILSYMTCYIGFIMAAFDDQKRTLHDHICDTRVISV